MTEDDSNIAPPPPSAGNAPPPPSGSHELEKTGYVPDAPSAPPAAPAQMPPGMHDLEKTGYVPEAAAAPPPAGTAEGLAVDSIVDKRYRIEEQIGQGGMGAVYRVTELETRECLALKTLNPELRGNASAMADLAKEVATARKLSHEHLLRVYSLETQGDLPYLVMEHVGGGDLDIRRKQLGGALPVAEATTRMKEVLSALGFLHGRGFVHRDVKPQNVLLTESGESKVTDFGISTSLKAGSTAAVGTPFYMAPEQMSGGEVTLKADIYAAGMMLYQLLTGTFPFGQGSELTLEKVRAWHLTPTTLPNAPTGWRELLEKAMAIEPHARFKNCREMAEAIDAVLAPSTFELASEDADVGELQTPKSGKAGLVVVALAVVALGAFFGLRGDESDKAPAPVPQRVAASAESFDEAALKLQAAEAQKEAMALKLKWAEEKQKTASEAAEREREAVERERQAEQARKASEIAALQKQLEERQRAQQAAQQVRPVPAQAATGKEPRWCKKDISRYSDNVKLICRTPSLWGLEERNVQLYFRLKPIVESQGNYAAMKARLNAWLKERKACGSSMACTERSYRNRIAELERLEQQVNGGY